MCLRIMMSAPSGHVRERRTTQLLTGSDPHTGPLLHNCPVPPVRPQTRTHVVSDAGRWLTSLWHESDCEQGDVVSAAAAVGRDWVMSVMMLM
jgi:hypothetical protein